MASFFKYVCILLCLFHWNDVLKGQSPIFHHYSVDDGLPGSTVYDALQDQQGYLWFGTDMGLCRFDGYTFQPYSSGEGLPYNDIWEIYLDAKGRLWLSSFGTEFIYLDEKGFHFVPYPREYKKVELSRSYKEDELGNLYFTNYRNTIFKFNQDSLIKVILNEHNSPAALNLIQPFIKGKELFSLLTSERTHKDSLRFDVYYQEQDESLKYHQSFSLSSLSNIRTFNLITLNKDSLLFFHHRSVKIISNNHIHERPLNFLASEATLEDFKVSYIEGVGYLLISSDKNLLLDQEFKIHDISSFIEHFRLNGIYKDHTGNLWILTKDSGIFYLPESGLQALNWNKHSGLINNQVTALTRDHKGQLIIGTGDGNLFFLENDQLILLEIKGGGKRRGKVRSIAVTEEGILFAVFDVFGLLICDLNKLDEKVPTVLSHTYSQKKYLETKGLSKITLPPNINHFPFATPKSIAIGLEEIWLSTAKGVVKIEELRNGGYEFIYKSSSRTYASALGKKNEIWVGKPDGLFLIQNGVWNELNEAKKNQDLLSKRIRDIKCDKNGVAWVATDSYGLYAFNNQRVLPIPETKNKIIKSVYIDQQNRIWATSNNGLLQIKCNGFNPFQYELRYFTKAHGLVSDEINCIVTNDSVAYIGSGTGLSKINLAAETSPQKTFPLHISQVSIQGKDTLLLDSYDLRPEQNNIRISFVGLSFESAGGISYELKMEGIDTSWQVTKDLQKDYPLLPYGNQYIFRLRAKNKEGLSSNREYKIIFKIRNPWWANTVFQLLGIFVVSLILYYLYTIRVSAIREKAREKMEVNKRLATLKLQALQARMNPHFIFNALQAIQDFIANQDERTANKYLSNFSRLMRLFLDSSIEKYIALDNELELLQLYLELEQLRFDPPFKFHFDIPENLDISTIEIPTMLLQPFVENAVNHGLRYKSGAGEVKIIIREIAEKLIVVIEDNGVGRAKAKTIQQKSSRSYVSRSTKIVEDRLNTLALLEEQQIEIQIQDLWGNGKPIGTRVNLEIELND